MTAPLSGIRRLVRLVWPPGVVIAAVGLLYLGTLQEGHPWGDDFSLYIAEARNLAEGRSPFDTGYLYNPQNPIGPTGTPLVFPLLLVPVYLATGINLAALKLVPITCFLLGLAAIFAVFRSRLPRLEATALVAILGFNPLIWNLKDQILSDFTFLALLYLGFLCIDQASSAPSRPAGSLRWAELAGLSCYLLVNTREVGWVLLAAWWTADLLTQRRITRPALLATAVCVTLIGLQHLLLPVAPPSQIGRFGTAPHMISSHVSYYSKELRDLWRNGYSGFFMRTLFLLMNGLAIAGYAVRWRRGPGPQEVFPILYLPVILLWPDFQGVRYLLPVLPLYIGWALVGLHIVAEIRRPGTATRTVCLLAAALGVTYAARYTTLQFGPLEEGIARPEARELLTYLTEHTRPDSVIVCAKPRAIALFTGRRSTAYHWTEPDQEVLRYFEGVGADYAVFSRIFFGDQEWFSAFLERYRDRFHAVFDNAVFRVYRIAAPPV